MKKLFFLVLIFLVGCATPFTTAGTGFVVTQANDLVQAVESTRTPTRIGKSCLENYLGLVVIGDGSIDAAKRDGRITSVVSVDREVYSVMGVYAKSCTVVTGN